MRKLLLSTVALSGIALVAGGILVPSVAHATPTMSIAIGASPTIVTGPTSGGLVGYLGTAGGISYNVTGTGSPLLAQPIFDTSSVNVSTTGTSVAYVWITQQGLTSPLGINNFLSGFTTNTWTGSVTSVVETTLISTTNQAFAGTLLATQTFMNDLSTISTYANTPLLTGSFSETAEYIITFGAGNSSANDTINLTAVPEPLSLTLLGTGLLGVGIIRRRRA